MDIKVKLEGPGAPVLSLEGRTLTVIYADAAAYSARCSADDLAIRKAVKVVSAEMPAPEAYNLPSPLAIVYSLAG